MGVIPFEFTGSDSAQVAGPDRRRDRLDHRARYLFSRCRRFRVRSRWPTAAVKEILLKCRIDTGIEIEYIENGGVLHYVLRNLAKAA